MMFGRVRFNENSVLLLLVLGVVIGQLWTTYRAAQPPLIYIGEPYLAQPLTVQPGDVLRWTSHLEIAAPALLASNYSIWNETCNTPALAADASRTRTIYVSRPQADVSIHNTLTVPPLPPGRYTLTRWTRGTNTENAFYSISFVVPGVAAGCPPYERQ